MSFRGFFMFLLPEIDWIISCGGFQPQGYYQERDCGQMPNLKHGYRNRVWHSGAGKLVSSVQGYHHLLLVSAPKRRWLRQGSTQEGLADLV